MRETVEGSTRIGVFSGQSHDGKAVRVYLARIRNGMLKPVEVQWLYVAALNKGAIVSNKHYF